MCRVDKDPAFGGIWENYAPEAYRPGTTEYGTFSRNDFVGWGGIAPITLLIENIIGMEFNAPENRVIFHLDACCECGIENMIFNGNNISVACTKYKPFKEQTEISVRAEKPFTLTVITKYLWYPVTVEVKEGENVFYV